MKINSINNINYRPFKAVKSATRGVSKEILDNREDLYDVLSDEKNVDIWTFKRTKGGMVNPSTGYIILIQNKSNGNVLKEITGPAADLKTINNRLKDSLIWLDAKNNYTVIHALKASDAFWENKKEGEKLTSGLLKAAMSAEANTWQHRFDLI